MDPITHLATGALGFQATQKQVGNPRFYVLYCLLASVIPDGDNFVSSFGPEAYLLYHRGLSHSIFMAPVLALVLVGIYRIFVRDMEFWKVYLAGIGLVLLHIFMDVITGYGTQILAPFSNLRASLDWVFIVDPILLLSMFILIGLGWFLKPMRRVFGVVGLCWIFAYCATNATVKQSLTAGFWSRLNARGEQVDQLVVAADALSPIFWKVIVDKDGKWEVATVNVFDIKDKYDWQEFTKADRDQMKRLGDEASAFSTFEWFVRFPYVEKFVQKGETKLTFGDVRFFSANPVMKAVRGERSKSPKLFTLNAILDASGNLTSYWFGSGPVMKPGAE